MISIERHYYSLFVAAFIFTSIVERAIVDCFFAYQAIKLLSYSQISILMFEFSVGLSSIKDLLVKAVSSSFQI